MREVPTSEHYYCTCTLISQNLLNIAYSVNCEMSYRPSCYNLSNSLVHKPYRLRNTTEMVTQCHVASNVQQISLMYVWHCDPLTVSSIYMHDHIMANKIECILISHLLIAGFCQSQTSANHHTLWYKRKDFVPDSK